MKPLIDVGDMPSQMGRHEREDPRTSFRQVQAQDAIIWTATLGNSYLQRIAADPHDAEASAWFASASSGAGTFEYWCRTFAQDPLTIRQHIAARAREAARSTSPTANPIPNTTTQEIP